MNLKIIIDKTENFISLISKRSAKTISSKIVKRETEKWVADCYSNIFGILDKSTKEDEPLLYLKKSWVNKRLNKKEWLKNLRIILKSLKIQQLTGIKLKKIGKKYQKNYIFSALLLNKIRKKDKKISVLGSETNLNWQSGCWNSCGILMRIILERTLDRKDDRIKQKIGLEHKINYSLSNRIFGKTLSGSLKKLQHSTKIVGDIVAHDSSILLGKNDIELTITPLNMIIKDVFEL